MVIDDDGIQPVNPNVTKAVENNRPQSQPNTGGADMPWMFGNPGMTFGAPLARSMGGEIVTTFKTELEEAYKAASKEYGFSVIPFDREVDTGFHFSCIVVTVDVKGSSRIPFYTLILEGTNNPIPTMNRTLPNNATVEITRLPSDAADGVLFRRIKEKLSEIFPGRSTVSVDSMVIPRDFDLKNKGAIHQIAYNAALACGTEAKIRMPGFEDISIPKMVNMLTSQNKRTNLTLMVNFGRQSKLDLVGMPSRSDVRCIFKDQPQIRQDNYSVNSQDQSSVIATTDGYIDVVYVGGNEPNPYMQYYQNQAPRFDNYAARLVLTDIDIPKGYTINSLLMALATVSALGNNNSWMQAFRPQSMDKKSIDITDVGALGYEVSFEPPAQGQKVHPKKIDTKSPTFDQMTFARLMTTLFKPGISISLDVPDAGPQTWYTSILAGASVNENIARTVINSANNLTGNRFGQLFGNNPVFTDLNNRIHLGYWINKNGERRDVREIDYLAVANLVGETDPNRIKDWSDTFYRTDIPLEIRLAERKRMITELTGGNVVFTGYAERVTFTSAFISALVSSIKECGLQANLVSPISNEDFLNMRGRGSFVDQSMFAGQSFATPNVQIVNPIMNNQFNSDRFF